MPFHLPWVYRYLLSLRNVTFCHYEWECLCENYTFLVQKSSRRCHNVTLRISHITKVIVTLNTPNNLAHVRIFIHRSPTPGITETPEHHMLVTDRYLGDSSQIDARTQPHLSEIAKTRSFWAKEQRSTEKDMEGQHIISASNVFSTNMLQNGLPLCGGLNRVRGTMATLTMQEGEGERQSLRGDEQS